MNFKPRGKQPLSTNNPLPARFNFGDQVIVYFGTAGVIRNCTVIKIHFTESKVSYDVEVKWKHLESADKVSAGVDKERELTDRLYNLDSAVVLSTNDFEQPHPEDYCKQCGGRNVTWSAENGLWNELMNGPSGIMCPQCFESMARKKGVSVIFRATK